MADATLELLRELTEAPGISGYESGYLVTGGKGRLLIRLGNR